MSVRTERFSPMLNKIERLQKASVKTQVQWIMAVVRIVIGMTKALNDPDRYTTITRDGKTIVKKDWNKFWDLFTKLMLAVQWLDYSKKFKKVNEEISKLEDWLYVDQYEQDQEWTKVVNETVERVTELREKEVV